MRRVASYSVRLFEEVTFIVAIAWSIVHYLLIGGTTKWMQHGTVLADRPVETHRDPSHDRGTVPLFGQTFSD